jgi:hypothetical protein
VSVAAKRKGYLDAQPKVFVLGAASSDAPIDRAVRVRRELYRILTSPRSRRLTEA